MKFMTHELPPKYISSRTAKITLIILGVLWMAFLIAVNIVLGVSYFTDIYDGIVFFSVSVLPFLILAAIWLVVLRDMGKAFVEVGGDKITVVDYYVGIRREKIYFTKDVATAEILSGYSMRVRGYRFSGRGCSGLMYIVFRGERGNYLFKVICSPETEAYFGVRFVLERE